jgi:hypothetical protein
MFALVESGSITKYFAGNKGIVIGDTQYPKSIFTLWSESDRNAIGIYTVEIDSTNKKDEEYYINTNITYAFADNKVTGSYGTATAKQIADTLFTAQDETDGLGTEGEVKDKGLKSKKKNIIKQQAQGLLNKTDWYVIKATEVESYSVPEEITKYRADVRAKSNEMETAIDNATDVDALKTLYTYTRQENGDLTRPLGEFPTEVV